MTLKNLDAHAAAVKSLAGYGLTAVSAEEIVSSVESMQPDEWARTLLRVSRGEAKRVRLFVVWNDIGNFTTFIYSGDKESTVAHLLGSLSEIATGEWVSDEADPMESTEADIEGYNPVACFDIGRELNAALRAPAVAKAD